MIEVKHQITVTTNLTLIESEARALDALVGYGDKPFLEVFYAKMGRHYMEPHEAGLLSLFSKIRDTVPEALRQVDKARALMEEKQ